MMRFTDVYQKQADGKGIVNEPSRWRPLPLGAGRPGLSASGSISALRFEAGHRPPFAQPEIRGSSLCSFFGVPLDPRAPLR